MMRSTYCAVAVLAWAVAARGPAAAHPEYQKWIQQNSGRSVNCGLCHVHPDGPVGSGTGQIGGLAPAEMDRLNQARAAFQPGREVNSPILNAFGNSIVRTVGKKQILALRRSPKALAAALAPQSDLDGDGIPDATEYLHGTHPLMASHGDPLLLFLSNVTRGTVPLGLAALAIGLVLVGLRSLRRGFALAMREEMGDARDG